MDVSMDVLGMDALTHDFERLSRSLQGKVNRQAVMAGARVARGKIRAAAPKLSGKLAKGIAAVSVRQAETPGAATAGVRVQGVRGAAGDPPFYWKFIELGTVNMAAAPFIRPTWDGSIREIEAAAISKLAEGIDRAITGFA